MSFTTRWFCKVGLKGYRVNGRLTIVSGMNANLFWLWGVLWLPEING